LLVDSHVLLWWFDGAERLSRRAAAALGDGGNELNVSVATLWELAIKQSLGKLRVTVDLGQHAREQGFQELPITSRHASEVRELPLYHGDPFDRMLVVQARAEGLTLVTADRAMSRYDVPILAA
jgi:PIN domain nuclease of toxin-antitoxin system